MRHLAVCLLLGSAAMFAQSRILSDEARANLHGPFSQPAEPFRLVGNVYYVGAQNIASHLIVTPDGHILVDTGTKEMEAVVRANIEELGFRLRDVKIILSTQAHFDHVGAHAALKKATDAQVMAIGDDAKALAAGKDLSPLDDEGWAPVPVDRVLRDGDTVTLGGTTLRAIWSPGHTPGSTTWVMTVQDGGASYLLALVAGLGPNNGVQLIDNPKHPTVVEQTLGTYEALRAIAPDIYVSGHPRQLFAGKVEPMRAGVRPHPLADRTAWVTMIEASEAGFLARVEAERAKDTLPEASR